MTLLLCILCLLFARPILRVARVAFGLLIVAGLLRGLLLLIPELAAIDWSGAILGAGAMAIVLLFGYRTIHNALVDADTDRNVARDKAQGEARKI